MKRKLNPGVLLLVMAAVTLALQLWYWLEVSKMVEVCR